MQQELQYFANGHWVPKSQATVSLLDHALTKGLSVFEGLRIYNGSIFRLQDHLKRLEMSAKAVLIPLPYQPAEIGEMCKRFVEINEVLDGHFIVRLSPGAGYARSLETGPHISIYGERGSVTGVSSEKGIRVKISSIRDIPPESFEPRIKCGGTYVNHALALNDARVNGFDEAVFLGMNGFVTELTGGNIFAIKSKVLRTPKKEYVLEGITRDTVIQIARKERYLLHEEDLTPYDLYTADELFTTGSGLGVIPIIEVEGRKIGEGRTSGPITSKIIDAYFEVTHTPGPWLTNAYTTTQTVKA